MRRHAGWGILAALLVGCAPPSAPEAELWTVRDFLRAHAADKDFGGWKTSALVALEGEPIPYRSAPHAESDAVQGPGYGLTVFPAFSDGQPASYVITEIWQDHPTPWVQPTWQLVREFLPGYPQSAQVANTQSIFPVGVESTFYSPFWRAMYVLAPDAKKDTFTSSAAVLNARLPMEEGSSLYCPIAPADGGVAMAQGDALPVHPWLVNEDVGLDGGTPLGVRALPNRTAWVEGAEVTYLGVGADRFAWDGQLPVEARLYVFAGGDGALLPIPAVLPADPFRSSFVRRIDVGLPATGAVFVPVDHPKLAAALAGRGVAVVSPDVDASLARVHLGAVIADTKCLTADAGFSGCTFLESAAAIESLNRALVEEREVTLAIAVGQVGARTQR